MNQCPQKFWHILSSYPNEVRYCEVDMIDPAYSFNLIMITLSGASSVSKSIKL
jgi:hypothetical protein